MEQTYNSPVRRNTGNKYTFFIIVIALAVCSCGDEAELAYEPGIYKPWKQDISPIYAFTGDKAIDGSSIKVTAESPDRIGDIIFKDMDPTSKVDPLRDPVTGINSIHLGKKNTAYVYCPTCLNTPMRIRMENDSMFLTPKNPGIAVKFDPYSQIGFAAVGGEEAELHTTMRCKTVASGFILSSYNIFVKLSSGLIISTDNVYYPDIDYLKKELRDNDTLVYVKKDTYFKKQ